MLARHKDDLLKVFSKFFKSGIINVGVNATFLVLLPKKDGASGLSDYRPICLVTNLYKIIAKVLSLRLRKVMAKIISPAQSAFVKGRQIMDRILIANECVDWFRKKRKYGLVCKIDLEKAYDRVNWEFHFWALKKRFWCERDKMDNGLLGSSSFLSSFKSSLERLFKSPRGLRQGDPLSPFLFTIMADAFNALMTKAKSVSTIEGFQVRRDGICISHLQYVDDMMCFIEDSEE